MIIRWRIFGCNGKCEKQLNAMSKMFNSANILRIQKPGKMAVTDQISDIFVLKVLSELFKRRQTVSRIRESRGDVKR